MLVARPVMVQCNPWENPVYFDGCCTHTEKIKFLLWHRVFVYTMEEVRMILYDYQFISKTFVYAILKTSPVKTWAYSLDTWFKLAKNEGFSWSSSPNLFNKKCCKFDPSALSSLIFFSLEWLQSSVGCHPNDRENVAKVNPCFFQSLTWAPLW